MMHIQNLNTLFACIANSEKEVVISSPGNSNVIEGFAKFVDTDKNAVGIRAAVGKEISFANREIINGTGCTISLVPKDDGVIKEIVTYDLFPGQDVLLIIEDRQVVGIAPIFVTKKEYKEFMTFLDKLKLDSVGWMLKVIDMVRLTEFVFLNS